LVSLKYSKFKSLHNVAKPVSLIEPEDDACHVHARKFRAAWRPLIGRTFGLGVRPT